MAIFNELVRINQAQLPGISQPVCQIESLDKDQNSAILSVITHPITIIAGKAGSGKTRTIIELVSFLIHEMQVDDKEILVCSMLGVVANKLRHLTGVASYTVNRLCGYKDDGNGRFIPSRNADNPIQCQYLIVDESTLLSNDLALALLRALPTGVRLVLVGDDGQVQSIQRGAFFSAVVGSKQFSQIHLKSNYRNKSTNIERLALDVISGNPIKQLKTAYSDHSLCVIQTENDEQTLQKIQQAIQRAGQNGMKMECVQVLTPTHKGVLGTAHINSLVKSQSNNGQLKVILNKTNYRLNLFNGQIGNAVINSKEICVAIKGKTLRFTDEEVFNRRFDLAYALTPHRVQGAEFDLVIVVIPYNCKMIDTNWLYSAMTRTKKSLVLIGDTGLIERVRPVSRSTFLERILANSEVLTVDGDKLF
ncbi:ATP-dependent DNA helicase [Shewanella aestuarii]|uniref:AAA family ATPase n=1 Tax=Shewanella aestuarii TaxID=1028752 RepID=A0A6G9QR30_9GAMM|nr:ATP-dependent RecD-like DNA helicase [Shewanella aestuarii]QIR16497.1 AAA family ATPase [Shewanella aestuarii]